MNLKLSVFCLGDDISAKVQSTVHNTYRTIMRMLLCETPTPAASQEKVEYVCKFF